LAAASAFSDHTGYGKPERGLSRCLQVFRKRELAKELTGS